MGQPWVVLPAVVPGSGAVLALPSAVLAVASLAPALPSVVLGGFFRRPSESPVQDQGQLLPQKCAFLRVVFPEGAAGEEADASWHSRSDFIPVAAVYAAVW